MLLAIRIASAVLIVSAIFNSPAILLAQTNALITEPATGRTAAVRRNRTTTAETQSRERFPSVFGPVVGGEDGIFLRTGGHSQPPGFAWIKFFAILLAMFVWLRGMRLCSDDRRNFQLQVDLWIEKLFVAGFAGIMTAILLPAYLLGTCVLVASCGVPFWRYVNWRNAQVGEQSPRLGLQHLIVATDIPFREMPDVTLELPLSLAPGASSATISLVGKTFTDRVTNAGTQDQAGNSSGFQLALALIGHAISMRATDLHIGAKDDRVAIRLRVDGDIVSLDPIPLANGLAVINVFKVLGDLSIADKRRSQDGSFRADVDGRRLCFRVSSQGTHAGEKLSIRILDPAKNFSTFSELGITGRMEAQLQTILSRRSGLVLFAGATGAGKSTTAYAGLRYLDSGDRNIVTIEDPIEYTIPSIDQIEVKTRAGQTFQTGLRSLLRQDADIVLIGEIRDEETAKIACQAATTGQLVLSTIHATDSLSAVIRMADLGVDHHHLAAALRGVVSQQLIRRLCVECRIAYTPDPDESRQLGLADFHGQLYQSPDPQTNACLNCHGRGFLGRVGVFELLDVTSEVRELIRDNAGTAAILSVARDGGMTTLWESGLLLVRDGIISRQEFDRAVDEL